MQIQMAAANDRGKLSDKYCPIGHSNWRITESQSRIRDSSGKKYAAAPLQADGANGGDSKHCDGVY